MLDRLVDAAPLRWFRRSRAVIAVGPAHSQLRRLDGLPAVKHRHVIRRIVRENSSAFFVGTSARMLVSDVTRSGDGSVWAAAFDAELIDSAIASLRRRPLGAIEFVPYVIAIAALLPPGAHCRVEDGVGLTFTRAVDGSLTHVARRACIDADVIAAQADSHAALERAGPAYTAAYGAAMIRRRVTGAWRPAADATRSIGSARVRRLAAVVLCILITLVAIGAPAFRLRQKSVAAAEELGRTGSTHTEATRVEGQLQYAAAQIDRMGRFRSARGQLTTLLGAISQAIPESTALVSLKVDSIEGSFIALAPHVADVLPQLADVELIASSHIVGSVTREIQGAARLERATVRFRRQPIAPK
jgi:hypothetical protein